MILKKKGKDFIINVDNAVLKKKLRTLYERY